MMSSVPPPTSWSRPVSPTTMLRPAPLRLEMLLERVLLLLDPVAAQRGIRLVRRFDAGLPPLVADPDLLSRAVENLVSNAIKYSPTGTEVSVSATSGDAAVMIAVADQGYGISDQDLKRIFDKWRQA